MCCFMFLSATNDLLHSGHFTFAWSCRCFWCWWWFKKYLGTSTKHLHWPGMADAAMCILRLWSLKYALEVALYLQTAESVQERISCTSSAMFNLWLPRCWISRLLLWKCFHSPDTKFVFRCSLYEQSFLLCKCLFLCFHWNPISLQRLIFYHSVWDFFAASEI